MSVNTVTRRLTTPVLCDPMFCLILRTDLTSVIMRLVERPSTTLDPSGNSLPTIQIANHHHHYCFGCSSFDFKAPPSLFA